MHTQSVHYKEHFFAILFVIFLVKATLSRYFSNTGLKKSVHEKTFRFSGGAASYFFVFCDTLSVTGLFSAGIFLAGLFPADFPPLSLFSASLFPAWSFLRKVFSMSVFSRYVFSLPVFPPPFLLNKKIQLMATK